MQHKPSELGVGAYFLTAAALVKTGAQAWADVWSAAETAARIKAQKSKRNYRACRGGGGKEKRGKLGTRARLPHATCPLDDTGFKPCMSFLHSSH